MSVDWTIGRHGAMRYVRVDQTTRLEEEELTTIEPGGSLTRSIDTDLKEEGELPCVSPPELGDDLIRIYYDVTDEDGNTESVALATMHAVQEASEYSSAAERANLTLYSALLTLQQAVVKVSATLAATSVAVDEAADICTDNGLPILKSLSTKALTVDHSWDAGTSDLVRVNELLDFANFWSARPDTWGRVVLEPYVSPAFRAPVWEFVSGAGCILVPQLTLESDAFSVPNVCMLICSNAEATLTGSYENDDPDSPYSTVTRGREIALVQTVDDAVDQASIDLRAQRKLIEATGAAERLTIQHPYAPITIGDVVRVVWPVHGLDVYATVQSQSIAFGPACMTTSILRRVRSDWWLS